MFDIVLVSRGARRSKHLLACMLRPDYGPDLPESPRLDAGPRLRTGGPPGGRLDPRPRHGDRRAPARDPGGRGRGGRIGGPADRFGRGDAAGPLRAPAVA